MKAVNEKGKLFGVINVIDLLILLVVVAVVVGVAWQILGSGSISTGGSASEIAFSVRVRGVMPRVVEDVNAQLARGNNQLIAGNDYVKDAYIESMTLEPYILQISTDDGQIVEVTDATRSDMVFTIKAKTSIDSAVIKVGNQEVRVGYGHFVKTQSLEFTGNIEKLVLPND